VKIQSHGTSIALEVGDQLRVGLRSLLWIEQNDQIDLSLMGDADGTGGDDAFQGHQPHAGGRHQGVSESVA
jgi:hypothetical protein